MTAIVLPGWALSAWGMLGKVPREVWYALAALAAWWWFSSHYYDEGRESVFAELREAEKKAQDEAAKARDVADTKAAERAVVEAEIIAGQIEAIEKAEANDENALDALF